MEGEEQSLTPLSASVMDFIFYSDNRDPLSLPFERLVWKLLEMHRVQPFSIGWSGTFTKF